MTARRPREITRHLLLGVRSAAAMAREDPLLLLVQTSRRAPARLTRGVARLLGAGRPAPGSARLAVSEWLAGHRDQAAVVLGASLALRRTGPVERLLLELAIELDMPLHPDHPAGAARAAWRRGDVAGAVAAAPARSAQRERLVSEALILQPGWRVPVPGARPSRPSTEGGTRALHVLTNSLPHTTSGYALRSHQVLLAQRSAGIDVRAATRLGYPVTIGRPFGADVEEVDGVRYHRVLPTSSPRRADRELQRFAEELAPLVKEFAPTVVHTTTSCRTGLAGRAVADAAGLPWVYEMRGVLEDTWAAGRPTPRQRAEAAASERHRLLREKETELARAADHVVVLNDTMRAELVERGVPVARVTVVPNAVPDALLSVTPPSSAAARESLGMPASGFWVGSVSSIVAYEGLEILLDAVRLVRDRGRDVRVCIVGDGVSRPSLVRHAARLRLGDAALLPGRVPPREADRYYPALDAFVVPRRAHDVTRRVTPLKPMAAMATGRPVIASDLPALAEVVSAPGTGLLVPPEDAVALADAIDALATDPARAARLGEAGRAFAATRTWGSVGRRYAEVYRTLPGGGLR